MNLRQHFCTFIITLLFSTAINGQVRNGDFEEWPDGLTTLTNPQFPIDSASSAVPLHWNDKHDVNIGYYRTTDAAVGRYALVLDTKYSYANTTMIQEGSIFDRPNIFRGLYKQSHIEAVFDTFSHASITVDILDINGELVGHGTGSLDTSTVYTEFSIPIEYVGDQLARSFFLSITNSDFACSETIVNECHFLYLDDLSFEVSTATLDAPSTIQDIFPNPSLGVVQSRLPFKSCEVLDLHGQRLAIFHDNENITLPELSGGYILRLADASGRVTVHKVWRY